MTAYIMTDALLSTTLLVCLSDAQSDEDLEKHHWCLYIFLVLQGFVLFFLTYENHLL